MGGVAVFALVGVVGGVDAVGGVNAFCGVGGVGIMHAA